MDEAKTLGTKVHQVAHDIANGSIDAGNVQYIQPEFVPYARAIMEFIDTHVREIIATEWALYSRSLGFGGTLDMYCELNDGSRAVVDYKTTSGLTREHGLQLAGYALLLKEHGYKVNRRVCVRLRKDEPGRWYARVYRDHQEDVAAFLACVTLWTWMHRKKLLKAVEAEPAA